MSNINEKRYPNINDAVAFNIAFAPMICTYGSVGWDEILHTKCSRCGLTEQVSDFLAQKSDCQKKDGAILDIYHYGVSITIRNLLIENFDITENDFRAIRNKKGEIVFYQITPQYTMQPLIGENSIKQLKPCSKCGSIQYRIKEFKNEQGWPYYYISNEAYSEMHDLNKTFENFDMHIPNFIVSRRVYDFLIKKYPRLNFEPLFLKTQR